MRLRTEIEIKPFEEKIDYTTQIFTIGSCFAQSIGERMQRAKFRTCTNPTGTLFNPMSVCATIDRLSKKRLITEEELHKNDLGWYHLDFHSSLSAPTKEETLYNINRAIEVGHEAITNSDWMVITLGTSWIYQLAESNKLVANCHKLPARNFNRTKLTVDEIVATLSKTIEENLKNKKIILTVSPIRHIADGLSENSLSKATLRLAIDELNNRHPQTCYFPSYEILMDDLRDYRFYASDMVHPTDVAIDYIWELFCNAALSNRAKELLPRVMKIIKATEHRPINPTSDAHKTLCKAQLKAISELTEVEMSNESDYFSEQLKIIL